MSATRPGPIPAALAELCPGPVALLTEARRQAVVDQLPLCRAVVESVLSGGPPVCIDELTALERVQVEFVEQFAFSVASVTDEHVEALLGHLSEAEVWSFVAAVYEIDMEVRLRLLAEAVL